jgi:putative addiction module component (TIGR02574 family)
MFCSETIVSMSFDQVLSMAMQLSADDKVRLIETLNIWLFENPDPEIEAAWAAEIERRIAEIDSGQVKLVPWEKVRDGLRREFAEE